MRDATKVSSISLREIKKPNFDYTRRYMKTKRNLTLGRLAWFIMSLTAVVFTIPQLTLADDERRYERREEWRHEFSRDDRRRLEGTWYLNGERDKPCTIFPSRDGLQARNERGETSRLVPSRYGTIRARDWEGGLRGEVRRNSIEWANGTTWTRFASRR
jgi:hypothetical protein